jgi:hypothetical protein
MLAALYRPVWTSGIVSVADFALACAAFPHDAATEKKSAQACSLRGDELIDKGAIITGE